METSPRACRREEIFALWAAAAKRSWRKHGGERTIESGELLGKRYRLFEEDGSKLERRCNRRFS